MGWLGKIISVPVREASHVLGTEHIRGGTTLIRQQWAHVSKQSCPACDEGRLFPFKEIVNGKPTRFLGCSACDHYQAIKIDKDPRTIERLRALVLEKIKHMSPEEYETHVRRYMIASRWCYGLALVVMCVAAYVLFSQRSAWLFINVMMVSAFMFVQGVAASYRCWQAREKCYFVPKSFKRWIRMGQWLM